MANVFDARDVNDFQRYGQRSARTYDDSSCGGDTDWSQGLKGLSKLGRSSPDNSGSVLIKVIESDIIPRLLLAHSSHSAPQVSTEKPKSLAEIGSSEAFAQLVLASEPSEIVEQVDRLRERGIALERIFLDLLAPVARKLGEFWEEDRCTFTDVTLGLTRLHQVLHEIGRRDVAASTRSQRRRAYFIPSPGEQHTFGLSMLEEFFLHAGWETASDHSASASAILNTVSTQELDIVGFTVGCNEFLEPLSDLIERVRKASRNPDVAVMVGGRLFLDIPASKAKLGAATVVCDGVHAVQVAEELIAESPRNGDAKKLM